MKNKLFILLCGMAISTASLTGCTSLFPNGTPNNGEDNNSQQQDNQDDAVEENNQSDNEVNNIVNNTLGMIERKLCEPVFTIDAGINQYQSSKGVNVVRSYDNSVPSERQEFSDESTSTATIEGKIDNLHYNKVLANNTQSIDRSSYAATSKSGDKYLEYKVENNTGYYRQGENGKYSAYTEENKLNQDKEIGYDLNKLYIASTFEYDITRDTIKKVLFIQDFFLPQSPKTFTDDFEFIDKTIRFIEAKIDASHYLNYVCTRILYVNVDDIPQDTRILIETALMTAQTGSLDDIFTIARQQNKLDVSLNYPMLLELIDSTVTLISTFKNYLTTEATKIDSLIESITILKRQLPTELYFTREFTLNEFDIITEYLVNIQFNDANLILGASGNGNVTTETYLNEGNYHFKANLAFIK